LDGAIKKREDDEVVPVWAQDRAGFKEGDRKERLLEKG
jgi:hypothetical protein